MKKKTRDRIIRLFAILAILGLVLTSLLGGLLYLI